MRNEFDYLNDVKMDFSVYEEKFLTDKERYRMKNIINGKSFKAKKYGIVAACVCLVVTLTMTAYATGFVDNIIKIISTGHNEFAKIDISGLQVEVPKQLKGALFDKDGNELENYKSSDVLYDKDGNVIDDLGKYMNSLGITEITLPDGNAVNVVKEDSDPLKNMQGTYTIIREQSKLAEKPGFAARVPQYIPEGFKFHGAAYLGDEGEYLFIYYINEEGEYFIIHERIINDETAFSVGTDGSIEETIINGNNAVLMDGRNVFWEEDGISLDVNGRNMISIDEVIKVAESMK